jgi:hypothetical protein
MRLTRTQGEQNGVPDIAGTPDRRKKALRSDHRDIAMTLRAAPNGFSATTY